MKRLIPYAIAALVSTGAIRAQEPASEPSKVGVCLESETLSQWIMHGLPYSQDAVTQVLGGLTYKGFSVTAIATVDEKKQVAESDFLFGYGARVGNVDLYGEAVIIDYHHADLASTCELSLEATLDTPIKPHLLLIRDVVDIRGTYAEAGVERTVPVMGQDVTTSLNVGYNDRYYRDGSGLSHVEVKLAFPLADGAVTPTITYSHPLADDLERMLGVGLRFSWER